MNPVPIDEKRITYFGETDARNKRTKFGIRAVDRTKHVYIIGKTGMGKSTLLENMAAQDIQNGEGMAFIDPHGKTADLLLEYVPKERIRDVVYIAPFDIEHPISFNVLESVTDDKKHLVVSGLMSTFKKIWVDAWSARMEYILTNTLLALLDYPGATLLGVNKMLSDKEYRKEVVACIKDPSVKSFWVKEFANYTERMAAEAVPAIQNKIGQFTANPLIRNMIGQPTSSFDIRRCMDERKILIINLSKGKIGDENMKLLGGLLVTKIYLAAMSRADVPDRVMKMLPNFYLFVDEFQNFANASFADILSEARKYKLNLTIAHQYIEQMDEVVRAAVFGNVGTMIIFRVGATDAEVLEKEFSPDFTAEDLVNLGFTQIYLKLMIDGLTSPPFSAVTLPPIPHPDISYIKEIIDASRQQFARPRDVVEQEIVKFHEETKKKPVSTPAPVSTSASGASSASASNAAPRTASSPAPATAPVNKPNVPKPVPSSLKPTPNTSVSKQSDTATKNDSHKPFSSALGELLKKKIQPASSTPSQPTSALVQTVSAPVQPAQVPAQQTVSLKSLAPQSQGKKIDPKQPSVENVNALKSVLANVLKKEAPKEASKASVASPSGLKPVQRLAENPSESQKEIPEDVLKKVLEV